VIAPGGVTNEAANFPLSAKQSPPLGRKNENPLRNCSTEVHPLLVVVVGRQKSLINRDLRSDL